MHAFDVLGDPVRRRILELLAHGEQSAGAITAMIQDEFSITQPAVSQHLKVLRNNGFTTVRPEGQRRVYAVDVSALRDVDEWLSNFRQFWAPRLDALSTEIARGKRHRRPDQHPAPINTRNTEGDSTDGCQPPRQRRAAGGGQPDPRRR